MNIGYFQFDPQNRTVEKNIDFIIEQLSETRDALIVLPELFLTKYFEFEPFIMSSLEQRLTKLLKLSERNKLGLVGSLPIIENGKTYNRCVYINEGKILGYNDKFHLLFLEKKRFSPGENTGRIFTYKHLTFLTEICMDVINPLPIHDAVQNQKIDLLCVSGTVSIGYLQDVSRTRSIENQIITIFTNRSGMEDKIKYLGQSGVFLPEGQKIFQQPRRNTELVITTVDRTAITLNTNRRKQLGIS